MQERYLCRAKRIDNGEWVEGFYFCMTHPDGRHTHHFIIPLGADLSRGTPIEKIQVEVDSSTVCRCAGLRDKNYKLIWENDIVSFTHEKYTVTDTFDYVKNKYVRNYVIEFENTFCNYGLRFRNKSIHFRCTRATLCTHDCEVLGNVFDNPELLEV